MSFAKIKLGKRGRIIMFQLVNSIEPINNDNNSLQYSPKLKRFINKDFGKGKCKAIKKVTDKEVAKNLPEALNLAHQNLIVQAHGLGADALDKQKYSNQHQDGKYIAIVSGVAVKKV